MSESAVHLLMAIHCHQPVGNFGFVFDEAYRKAYEPFVATLERHPAVRVTLHYSGALLEWLGANQPAFLGRIRRLAARGQVELLASGSYEPILPLIPEEDRQGQIALMRRMVHRAFGVVPEGLWLTERVWEPELPQTLQRSGIRYTFLDSNQFQVAAGVLPGALQVRDEQNWDLLGCYATEYAGSTVVLFPASKRLRYWVPFQEVSKTMEFLKRLKRSVPVAVTYADDGEKFGLWPKTHAWVYEQGWLERFLSAVERESSWLSTSTCGQYLDTVGPNGRVYLPCGSYEEMLEWSGGYFRNFFVKYPEANAMLQKMLDVSRMLQDVASEKNSKSKRRRASSLITHHSSLIARAQQELYQAQCNDAYWHGVFGGLYLAHLRRAVYRHLLTAERLVRQASGRVVPFERRDLDGDGQPELILRNPTVGVVVDPDENGTITEIDVYHKAVNLLDTLSRRYEPYHEKLRAKQPAAVVVGQRQAPMSIHDLVGVKEAGLQTSLAYDDHRRSGFVDYALSAMPTLQEIVRATWGERRLWSAGPWEVGPGASRRRADRTTLTLARRLQDGTLQKTITVFRRQGRLAFRYELIGLDVPVTGLEFTLGLQDERWSAPDWREDVRTMQVQDAAVGLSITMKLDPPATVACFPIETVSESEEGLERTPQGLAVVYLWPSRTDRRRWSCTLEWTLEDLPAPSTARQAGL